MVPFEFFLELLYPLPMRERKMFGITSFYLGDKIICAVNDNSKWPNDIGIWISTPMEFHNSLLPLIQNHRFLTRIPTKKWILLPADSDTFEEDATIVAELIKKGSNWIGTVPKPKKKKLKK